MAENNPISDRKLLEFERTISEEKSKHIDSLTRQVEELTKKLSECNCNGDHVENVNPVDINTDDVELNSNVLKDLIFFGNRVLDSYNQTCTELMSGDFIQSIDDVNMDVYPGITTRGLFLTS